MLRLHDGCACARGGLTASVQELHRLLARKGYDAGPGTCFGGQTEEAVKQFQQDHGLVADGIVGPLTWAKLLEPTRTGTDGPFATTYPPDNASLVAHLREAEHFCPFIEEGARRIGVPTSVICAIGSRESGWGLTLRPLGPAGTGDWTPRPRPKPFRPGALPPDGGGFGRGLMQIDFDAHGFARTGDWQDPRANILYGCRVLKNALALIERRAGLEGVALLRPGLASYNCGAGTVLKALRQGRDLDAFTAHHNYSRDVLDRAGWFQRRGWP